MSNLFQRLITTLDGRILGKNRWMGLIGKLPDSVTELPVTPSYARVNNSNPLISLSPEVIEDLSSDPFYAYNIVESIRSRVISNDIAMLEIGPVNHGRWLTTANPICRLWVLKHTQKDKDYDPLKMVVEFIIGVHIPTWFLIKVKYHCTEGPQHVLYQHMQLRKQSRTIVDMVMPTVQGGAWYAFSENILQTMLCSENEIVRRKGIERIIQIRQNQWWDSNFLSAGSITKVIFFS